MTILAESAGPGQLVGHHLAALVADASSRALPSGLDGEAAAGARQHLVVADVEGLNQRWWPKATGKLLTAGQMRAHQVTGLAVTQGDLRTKR